ncbi:MAG: hypothetical protein RL226_1147 [Bacteroidota bacterium]|jgi:hypothetical protein
MLTPDRSIRASRGRLLAIGLIFIGFFALSFTASSQYADASLTSEGLIQLPENQEIHPNYQFDISALGLSTEQEMVAFMASFRSDEFLFRANPAENKGILILRMEGRKDWSVAQWNKALRHFCTSHPVKK